MYQEIELAAMKKKQESLDELMQEVMLRIEMLSQKMEKGQELLLQQIQQLGSQNLGLGFKEKSEMELEEIDEGEGVELEEAEGNDQPDIYSDWETAGSFKELGFQDDRSSLDEMIEEKSEKIIEGVVSRFEGHGVFDDKSEREVEEQLNSSYEFLKTDSIKKIKRGGVTSPVPVLLYDLVKNGENNHDFQIGWAGGSGYDIIKKVSGFYRWREGNPVYACVYERERNLEYKSRFKRVIKKNMIRCGVKKGLSKMQSFQFDPGIDNAWHENTDFAICVSWFIMDELDNEMLIHAVRIVLTNDEINFAGKGSTHVLAKVVGCKGVLIETVHRDYEKGNLSGGIINYRKCLFACGVVVEYCQWEKNVHVWSSAFYLLQYPITAIDPINEIPTIELKFRKNWGTKIDENTKSKNLNESVSRFVEYHLFLPLASPIPLPTFYKIVKKKSAQEFKSDSYLAATMSCIFRILQCLLFNPSSTLVLTINNVRLAMEIIYGYLDGLLLRLCSLLASLQLLLKGFTLTMQGPTLSVVSFIAFGILLYASSLTRMRKVIETKSLEYILLWFSVAAFSNGVIMTIYSCSKFDAYIFSGI